MTVETITSHGTVGIDTRSAPYQSKPNVHGTIDLSSLLDQREADGEPDIKSPGPVPVVDAIVSYQPHDHTVEEVVAWVGDDTQRAQHARDLELAGAERSTLITALNHVLGIDE